MLVFATVAVLILAVGLAEFVYFEPPGQVSGVKARIVGVYAYNPTTQTVAGADQGAFARTQVFAAVVDWSTLPSDITVDARWYDSFGNIVGRVGPGTPAHLAGQTVIPVSVPRGLQHVLPGHYSFVVQRLNRGVPVEVLARRIVLVERS